MQKSIYIKMDAFFHPVNSHLYKLLKQEHIIDFFVFCTKAQFFRFASNLANRGKVWQGLANFCILR